MDPVSLGGMYESLKTLTGIAKVAGEAILDSKVKAKVFELQQGLYDLQAKALEDQQGRMELLNDLDKLRRELQSLKDARSKLECYELFSIDKNKLVCRSKQGKGHSVDHYVCPNCFARGEVSVLQGEQLYNQQTRWLCHHCKFSVDVGQEVIPKFLHHDPYSSKF